MRSGEEDDITTKAPRHQEYLGVLVPWWLKSPLLKSLAKYYAIFRIELRQLTTYTWDFILSNITIVLFFYVLLQVWQITASPEHVSSLEGEHFTWEKLLWFLAGGQILYFSVQTEAQLDIENDVISGNIAVTLARPYDYLLARFAVVMANTVLSFAVAFPAAFIMAWIASGTIAVTPVGIIAFTLAFLLRTLLFFALQAIAGLATFWIEKATAFVWIIGLLILIFGGGAVPLGFWPQWAQTAVEFTPFPAMMYYPAKLFVDPRPELILGALLRGIIWLVILGGIVMLIYKRALRRLDINGG
jgi:ABC-2 type transport system permease protein